MKPAPLKPDDDFVYQRAFIYTVGPSLFMLILLGGLRAFELFNAPAYLSFTLAGIIALAFICYCWVNRVALAKRGAKGFTEKKR